MAISLLITHTSNEKTAAAEILDALLPLDSDARVIPTGYKGVLLVDTKIEPLQASNAIIRSLPSVIKRIVPLMGIVRASMSEIVDLALEIMKNFIPFRSFAVRATIRGSCLGKQSVEKTLGAAIKNNLGARVDLGNPEIIIFVEVVDDIAGISVVSSSHPILVKSTPSETVQNDSQWT
jgi:tRNA acetyltransferase TAN1